MTTMQTFSSPLSFLDTTAPGDKSRAPAAGPHIHKSARTAAETRLDNSKADGAHMPEARPSFSRMLHDQTARARPDETRSEATTEPQGGAGTQEPSPSSAEHAAGSDASLELNALLASLMQGQGPVQTERGAKPARLNATTTTMETQEAATIGGSGHAKGRTPRSAGLSVDRSVAADGQAGKPGTNSANREVVSAGTAAARAALGGVGAVSATGTMASEASQHLKSALQRIPSSDSASANAAGSINASANSGQLNMPTNSLLPGGASTISASAASAAIDTALPQDVRRPEFVPAFSARIATLVQEGVEHARVHLNPVEMGPVSLQLSLDGQQVRVDMMAEVAATRQVLEQALPALAGALREAGFTLSGGGVSQPVTEAANLTGHDPRNAGGSSGETSPQTSGAFAGPAGQQADGGHSREQGPNQGSRAITATEGLAMELQLDAEGRPHLPQGRGLVDTFA